MQRSRKIFSTALVPLIIFAIGVAALTLVPTTRLKLLGLIASHSREVLAKVDGDLTGQGDLFEVVKIKTSKGINLEIYRREGQTSDFFTTLRLDERRDGYFDFHGRAVNLVLADLDKDGTLEILTATYDENLMPRLYAFRYNKDNQQFEMLGPDNFKL